MYCMGFECLDDRLTHTPVIPGSSGAGNLHIIFSFRISVVNVIP